MGSLDFAIKRPSPGSVDVVVRSGGMDRSLKVRPPRYPYRIDIIRTGRWFIVNELSASRGRESSGNECSSNPLRAGRKLFGSRVKFFQGLPILLRRALLRASIVPTRHRSRLSGTPEPASCTIEKTNP